MGGKNSTESGRRSFSRGNSFQDRSYSREQSWNQPPTYHGYPPQSPPSASQGYDSAYPWQSPYSQPPVQPPPQQPKYSSAASSNVSRPQRTLDRRYSKIADNYRSLDQVCS